jgi:hypothetical protein
VQEEEVMPDDDSSPENNAEGTPWFGPKRFGLGYRPQTWQGFLVVAAIVLLIVVVATVTGGRSPLMALLGLPALAMVFLIRSRQRRW